MTKANVDEFLSVYEQVNREMWRGLRTGELDKDRVRRIRFTLALERIGIKDDELGQKLNKEYVSICPLNGLLIPGAIELLKEITALKKLIVICSNGFSETQIKKLQSTGMDCYIQSMYCSDDLNTHKPDPKFFHQILQLEEVDSSEVLYIGDDLKVDGSSEKVGIKYLPYNYGENIYRTVFPKT